MPTTLPSSPTYLRQRPVTPASIATRRRHDEGRIASRYSADCRSKISNEGTETTRVALAELLGRGEGELQLAARRQEDDVPSGAVSWTAT